MKTAILILALLPLLILFAGMARDYWRDTLPDRPVRVRIMYVLGELSVGVVALLGIMLMVWLLMSAL